MHLRRLLLVPLTLVLTVTCVHAATFTVDRTDDEATPKDCDDATPNDCSLRGAILAANALAEASTINVPAGTYVLSQSSTCTYKHQGNPNFFTTSEAPLCVAKNEVTIQGAGAATTIIEGNGVERVLYVSADATVQLLGVTITKGRLANNGSFGLVGGGGGINNQGTLTMTESTVTENRTSLEGGGIYNAGTLTVLRSTVSRNTAYTGAIYNKPQATLTVADSTISDNSVDTHGGGIMNVQGTVTITGSTISNNTALGLGGGISTSGSNLPALLSITNSTLSGNTSRSSGAGIYNGGSAANSTVHLSNVTITNNTAGFGPSGAAGGGGGVSNGSGNVLTLENTIIAGNQNVGPFGLAPDCGGTLTSQGYNLIQNTANCIISGDTIGNITGQDPQLGLLVDNGGLTKTHASVESSPAVDAGNPAAPGSGGFVCAALDQRGFLRPLGATCDIGAFERGGVFSLAKVRPNTGGNSGSVSTVVSGNGFASGATVKLTRVGEADIVGIPVQGDVGGSAIAATFDLAGRSIGLWDVVVMNPDGVSKTLTGGFIIEEGGAPQLWVDVIGRFFRPGRPSRLTIVYGNRGNVDAVAVPLSLSLPAGYTLSRFFAIAPPPPQPGQVRDDWSQVPVHVLTDAQSGFINIPLLLPVVPAGFTGILQIGLTLPPGAQDNLLLVALGDPVFDPGLDPEVVSDAVAGAQAYLQNEGVTVPPALVPDLEQYVTNQFQQVKESGRAAFVASLGTQSQIYSMSQLHFDLVFFAAARAAENPQAAAEPENWLSTMYRSLVSLMSQLGPAEVQAQQQNCPVYKKGGALVPGCSGGGGPDEPFFPPEIPIPPGCNLKDPSTFKNCKATPDHCDSLPGYKVVRNSTGEPFCVPEKPSNNCSKLAANPVGSNQGCTIFPLRPRDSFDPNDKVGTLGVTPAQFLLSATPLSYTVFFENLESATAAAQEVVITDQLDVNTMDLDTFSLGLLSFGGDTTLVPAPGVQQYTGGVDLRPEQNLIVTITANLDKASGVLTWRFTSIDPDTGQFTEDPEAGFLPPNVNSPEGEGSVVFTVEPKSGLASGTTICNQASIVFDTNAPIETPQWCNTIDEAPPSSVVQSLSATQSTPDFPVQWAGSDVGSGIGSYSLYVSDTGGPFSLWLEDTTELTALFPGARGHTYAFYSVARDLVGNEEAAPAQPDTTTRVAGPVVELCGNCLDDDGDGKIDWLDSDCEAAALAVKKAALDLAKPAAGDDKISLIGSFAPATIEPPAQGVTLSFIQPGTGATDPDVVLACVQIPPGAQGWVTAKSGVKWTFKDTKGGPLGDPDSKDALAIKYNAKKQRYDLVGAIAEAEVGALTAGDVSTQLSIGGQGWEKTQPWQRKSRGKRLVTP